MFRFVWILTHFEFLGPPYWLDDVVCRVASSRSGALRLLRQMRVDPGTWSGLQCARVDDLEGDPGRQELYSRTGRRIRRGYTLKQALKLSRKVRARNAARYRAWQREKKKGGTKQSPSRPS